MRLFRFIAQFFQKEAVYCEDCIHCVPGDYHHKDKKMCKAHPIKVDLSEKDTYVKRGAKVKIVETYKSCHEIRLIKAMPVIYDSTCWKFDKK
jgi:hypothetical protein